MKLKNKCKLETPISMRELINFNHPTKEILSKMSENNKISLNILLALKYSDLDWLATIACLEDMNIRGEQLIWAFAFADNDIKKLKNFIFNRDTVLVDSINMVTAVRGGHFKAMPYGATKKLRSPNLFERMELLLSMEEKNLLIDTFQQFEKEVNAIEK